MGEPSKQGRLHARVRGRVQGVGYRQFVERAALNLGLVGFVRNESSGGSVEVLAEGREEALAAFLERLESGPLLSRVAFVDVAWEPPTGAFSGFKIRS